jgi:hypothetical protein
VVARARPALDDGKKLDLDFHPAGTDTDPRTSVNNNNDISNNSNSTPKTSEHKFCLLMYLTRYEPTTLLK